MESGKSSASGSVDSVTEYINELYTESVIVGSTVVSIDVLGDDVGCRPNILSPEESGKSMQVLGTDNGENSTSTETVPKTRFRKMYLAALAALMNAVSVGMSAAYSATATDNMKGPNNLNPDSDEVTWIGSLMAIGALFGSLAAGTFAGKLGRKKTLLFNTFPYFLGWLLITYAPSVPFVFAGRLLTGFGSGLACVAAPMYLVEISTPEIRGLLGACFQLFVTIGVLLDSIVGYYFSWRWLAMSGAIVSTFSIVALTPMPETPRWLMSKNRPKEAAAALKFLQGRDYNVTGTCRSLEGSMKVHSAAKLALKEFKGPTRIVMKAKSMAQSPAAYKSTILSIALMLFQQFSGINAVMFYTVSIFEKAGSADPKMHTIILNTLQVLATFCGSVLMDKAGRKILLFVSGFVMTLSLISLGSFSLASFHDSSVQKTYSWVPLLCLGIFIISFSVGFGPIPWLMVAEMSPSRFRNVITGLATALNWTFVFIVTKSFDSLRAGIRDYGAYWLYAVFCGCSCIVTFFFLPETKGKTLDEIQEFFLTKKQKEMKVSLTVHESSEHM